MKGSGELGKLVVKESFGMLTVIVMKVNGLMIRQTAMGFTCMLMGPSTLEIGRMTFNMVTGKKLGLMAVHSRVTTLKVKNVGRVSTSGTMDPASLVTGKITRSPGSASISGLMVVSS